MCYAGVQECEGRVTAARLSELRGDCRSSGEVAGMMDTGPNNGSQYAVCLPASLFYTAGQREHGHTRAQRDAGVRAAAAGSGGGGRD